eukprot:CAMPEP_0114680138 /NCGR_PEP_ID=MMETSP0191-20121206/53744_1 /TAXON_ID=126664 /ORGANISM="Sorites sp." /LENGTH=182 /DNA_ID=CAMNT_0001956453 /DNA_START=13 /DNA_END=558 /DNA_ORIENTATION=+
MPKKRKNTQAKRKPNSNSGLGKALKNKYGAKGPKSDIKNAGRMKRQIIIDGFKAMKNDKKELISVTEVSNLQEYMDTVIEQNRINEEMNEIKLIDGTNTNDVINDEKLEHQKLDDITELYDYENLPIPKRPKWDKNTKKDELQINERNSFLKWRRNLAYTAQKSNLVMTPFEKNIDIWRQLW